MEEDFQTWLEKRNAGWYLNQFIDEIEEKRKEQNEDEMV